MKTKYLKHQIIGFLFCCSLLISGNFYAQCTDPVISSTSGPGSVCNGETAMLTATHDGQEVKWYDAATGGNELATGDTFTTSALTTNTSFWAESSNTAPNSTTLNTARPSPAGSSQYTLDNSGCGLVIDVTQDFTLNSFEVYHDGSAETTSVELRDSGGNVVGTKTFNLPAGNGTTPHTISVNFNLTANETYWLIQPVDIKMVRELGGSLPANYYPLAIDNVASITSALLNGSPGSQNYYFYYNWEITIGTDITCTSARVEEAVTVNETPMPTGNSDQTFDTGETLADLDVTGQNLQWYADDLGTTSLPNTTPLVDGTTYYVSQTLNTCEGELLEVNVTENLSASNSVFSGLVVYPTLVENQLFIENKEFITKVEIYNLLGKKLLDKKIDGLQTTLELSNLNTGVQLVKVFSAHESKVVKIVKK